MMNYTPKIVDNFWNFFEENKNLINRCFNHLFKRLPDYEGRKYSYNNLIIRMHELNVFCKFSLKKIAIKEKKEHLINKNNLTKKDLIESGVNVSKRWENYIYNWIRKILLERSYIENSYQSRYIYNSSLFDYPYKENYTYWAETEYKKSNNTEETNEKKPITRRGKIYPPHFDNRIHPSEEYFDNPLDTLLAAETEQLILDNLNCKYEKEIYNLLKQEICSKDISYSLKLSISYTNKKIRKIRNIIRSNTTTLEGKKNEN
jgi:hypothetical protein